MNAGKRLSLARDSAKLKQSIGELETQIMQKTFSVAGSAFDLAEAYHQQKVYVSAEDTYKIAIAKWRLLHLNKQELEATASLGMLYRAMGRYQESEELLRAALSGLR